MIRRLKRYVVVFILLAVIIGANRLTYLSFQIPVVKTNQIQTSTMEGKEWEDFIVQKIQGDKVRAQVVGEDPVWLQKGTVYNLRKSDIQAKNDQGTIEVTTISGKSATAHLIITRWHWLIAEHAFAIIGDILINVGSAAVLVHVLRQLIKMERIALMTKKRIRKEKKQNPHQMDKRFYPVWAVLNEYKTDNILEQRKKLIMLWHMYKRLKPDEKEAAQPDVNETLAYMYRQYAGEKQQRVDRVRSFSQALREDVELQ